MKTADGKTYYANVETKTTTWERPIISAAPAPVSPTPAAAALGDEPLLVPWLKMSTADGKTYYANPETKTTSWERPVAPAAPAPPPEPAAPAPPSEPEESPPPKPPARAGTVRLPPSPVTASGSALAPLAPAAAGALSSTAHPVATPAPLAKPHAAAAAATLAGSAGVSQRASSFLAAAKQSSERGLGGGASGAGGKAGNAESSPHARAAAEAIARAKAEAAAKAEAETLAFSALPAPAGGNEPPPPPPAQSGDWLELATRTGRTYFYNVATRETSW